MRWNLAAALFVTVFVSGASGDDQVKFSRDILPVLSDNCFACHGPDQNKRQGGLRLDLAESAFQPADSGMTPIVWGKPDQSEVIRRILSQDRDTVMPPPDSHKVLTAAQKDLIRRWVEQGAPYEKHWAFVTPTKPEVPEVSDTGWIRTPVDGFILARLEKEGLKPRPEANRSTQIRRLAFALTGLPPTPQELADFASDQSSYAYQRLVQRYLDSPRFGEEMARHWLDVARYADTHGLHLDNEREMWAYRDWVIAAFNRNLPFDQFTIEQLAGDLLPNPTQDQLVATGFNRCNVTTSEGGSIEAEFLYRYAVDRTSTMIQTWMGLTGGCAVCHGHKYDPLTTREFYSLYSFFYSAADPAMDRNIRNTDPFLRVPTPEQQSELDRLRAAEQAAKRHLESVAAKLSYVDPCVAAGSDGTTPAEHAAVDVEDAWLDDVFPLGATVKCSTRNSSVWTAAPQINVRHGRRALRQASAAKYEDKFENATIPLIVPQQATFEIWVRTDPFEPPHGLMLELTTSKGPRRAFWGNAEKLGGSEPGKSDRLQMGELPPAGDWTRLVVNHEQWQLEGGEAVRGVALAQFGGIVHWDALTVRGRVSPANDPRASFLTWWKSRSGQDTPGLPGELQTVIKSGPEKEISADQRSKLQAYFLAFIARPSDAELKAAHEAWEQATAARAALEEQIPGTFIFKNIDPPRDAFVMLRGQYDKPGEKVGPDVPAVLPPLRLDEPDRRPTRMDLARWLVSAEHPMTARVAVNRIWQQLFGTGLVKTSYDFGAQGEPPSHPELLDWLAVHYRESGWDTKELVRLLVTSAAFRQDARVEPESLRRDPENRLYARGPRFRLDAEQIRDNALFVSGVVNLQMGGPGVKPYQPPNIWEPVGYSDSNTRYYLQDHGPALYRRSIYCFLKRTAPPPFMSNFDGPNREQFCTRRERSNTPLQALQLMNDVQHFEAARGFAERILAEGGASPEPRLTFAYLAALSRAPNHDELQIVKDVLNRYLERYQADESAAQRVIRVGESRPKSTAPAAELAAYTLIANLILNLDETITRN